MIKEGLDNIHRCIYLSIAYSSVLVVHIRLYLLL